MIPGKYEHIGDEKLRQLKENEDRSTIHIKTFSELVILADEIQPLRSELYTKKEKLRFNYQSDAEIQYQSALAFLNINPNPEKFAIELDKGLKANRKTFVGTLLSFYENGLFTQSEMTDSKNEIHINIIEKGRALFNELSGITEVENDLIELSKVEARINNFIDITNKGKYHYMFFADAKMLPDEISQSLKYLYDNSETIPLETRLKLKRQIAEANPEYVNDYSNMPIINGVLISQ